MSFNFPQNLRYQRETKKNFFQNVHFDFLKKASEYFSKVLQQLHFKKEHEKWMILFPLFSFLWNQLQEVSWTPKLAKLSQKSLFLGALHRKNAFNCLSFLTCCISACVPSLSLFLCFIWKIKLKIRETKVKYIKN